MSEIAYTPNYIETKWLNYFGDDHHSLKVAALSFIVHEIFLFGRYLPYYIADHLPVLRRFQIQSEKRPTRKDLIKCLKYLLYGQGFFQLPLFMGFYPVSRYLGMELLAVPFPGVGALTIQMLFFLFTEDAYHYAAHLSMHRSKYLYNKVHKVHHEYTAPFGIVAEYAHPVEILVLGLGFFLGPNLLLLMGFRLHMFTMLVWIAVRLIETVDVHAGFNFPWTIDKYVPFWGGAEFHDYHHMKLVGNYSSSLRWLDWLFGTDKGFKKFKERLAMEKYE